MVASRLIWTLLAHSAHPDDLLMEFLALEPAERRHPMGPEQMVTLLTARPAAPPSERLHWLLRQLARTIDRTGTRPRDAA